MNKGQIVKIKYNDNNEKSIPWSGYGICIDPNTNLYVLENGNLLHDKSICPDYMNGYQKRFEYNFRRPFDTVEISATRNVPENIRIALTSMGKEVVYLIQERKRYDAFMEEHNKKYDEHKTNIQSSLKTIRSERGILTKDEFIEEFIKQLSPAVQRALKDGECRAYNGWDGKWNVRLYSNIQIERSVWIDKYIGNSYDFTYREYDGCLMIDKETKQYKQIMEKYHKELPVKDKPNEEYLTIGDKESLEYHENYIIPIDKSRPHTKAYAKELADKFCGVKKERKQELQKDEYEIER